MKTSCKNNNCPIKPESFVQVVGPSKSSIPLVLGPKPVRAEMQGGGAFSHTAGLYIKEQFVKYDVLDINNTIFSNVNWCYTKTSAKDFSSKVRNDCARFNIFNLIYNLNPSHIFTVGSQATGLLLRKKESSTAVNGGMLLWSPILEREFMALPSLSEKINSSYINERWADIFKSAHYYGRIGFTLTRPTWRVAEDIDEVRKWFKSVSNCTGSFDVETGGLKFTDPFLGIGFYSEKTDPQGFYIPINFWDFDDNVVRHYWEESEQAEVFQIIYNVFSKFKMLTGWNVQFDLNMTRSLLGKLPSDAKFMDGQLLKFLYKPAKSGNRLDDQIIHHPDLTGYTLRRQRDLINSKGDYLKVPLLSTGYYCIGDNETSYKSTVHYASKLTKSQRWLANTVFSPAIPIYAEARYRGIKVDEDYLLNAVKRLDKEQEKIIEQYEIDYGINPNSPDQVANKLFAKDQFDLKPIFLAKNKNSHPTTKKDHLVLLRDRYSGRPRVQNFIDKTILLKEYKTMQSRYGKGLYKWITDGRIHPSSHLDGTETGRRSYSGPNHNFPNRSDVFRFLRGSLIPDFGKIWIEPDFTGAELVILGNLSQDPVMMRAFAEGVKLHNITGALIAGVPTHSFSKKKYPDVYGIAKTWNFNGIYGGAVKGIVQKVFTDTGIKLSLKEGKQIRDEFEKTYKVAMEFRDYALIQIAKQGYVELPWGHRRYGTDYNALFNTLIQGTNGLLMLYAIVRTYHNLKKEKVDFDFVWDIHDSSTWQGNESDLRDFKVIHDNSLEEACLPINVKYMKCEYALYKERWGESVEYV